MKLPYNNVGLENTSGGNQLTFVIRFILLDSVSLLASYPKNHLIDNFFNLFGIADFQLNTYFKWLP